MEAAGELEAGDGFLQVVAELFQVGEAGKLDHRRRPGNRTNIPALALRGRFRRVFAGFGTPAHHMGRVWAGAAKRANRDLAGAARRGARRGEVAHAD